MLDNETSADRRRAEVSKQKAASAFASPGEPGSAERRWRSAFLILEVSMSPATEQRMKQKNLAADFAIATPAHEHITPGAPEGVRGNAPESGKFKHNKGGYRKSGTLLT